LKNAKAISVVFGLLFLANLIFTLTNSTGKSIPRVEDGPDTTVDNTSFNMKNNSFVPFVKPKPAVPSWGSFKIAAEPEVTPTKNNDAAIAELAKKASKKIADEKKKKKKKVAAKKAKKNMLVDRSKRNFGGKTFGIGPSNSVQPAQIFVSSQLKPKDVVTTKKEELPPVKSLEEWEKDLLVRPNPTAAKQLLSDYQSNKLKDPSWFYLLSQKMIESPDQKIRLEGVAVLDQNLSVTSFTILSENRNKTDDVTGQKIQVALDKYAAKPESSTILLTEIQSKDLIVQTVAFEVLHKSIETNLLPNPKDPKVVTKNTATLYGRFLPVLQNISQKDDDAAVRGYSTETLNLLNQIGLPQSLAGN
jgi:hypothetical protein